MCAHSARSVAELLVHPALASRPITLSGVTPPAAGSLPLKEERRPGAVSAGFLLSEPARRGGLSLPQAPLPCAPPGLARGSEEQHQRGRREARDRVSPGASSTEGTPTPGDGGSLSSSAVRGRGCRGCDLVDDEREPRAHRTGRDAISFDPPPDASQPCGDHDRANNHDAPASSSGRAPRRPHLDQRSRRVRHDRRWLASPPGRVRLPPSPPCPGHRVLDRTHRPT